MRFTVQHAASGVEHAEELAPIGDAASHCDRSQPELDIPWALSGRRGLACSCQACHYASAQRTIGIGQTCQSVFEHSDEDRVDPSHQEHAAIGEAGLPQEHRATEGTCCLGGLDASGPPGGIAATNLRFTERNP